MPNIIISAHGGRWSHQQQNLVVPAGSAVDYYVNDGGILSNNDGYAILAQLQAGHEPGGHVAQAAGAGTNTWDYSCWYAPEFAAHCGIYQVGSAQRLASLDNYSEANPLHLSAILQQYPNCTIYWVCCREVAQGMVMQRAAADPSASPTPRLRAAMHAGLDAFLDHLNHEPSPRR